MSTNIQMLIVIVLWILTALMPRGEEYNPYTHVWIMAAIVLVVGLLNGVGVISLAIYRKFVSRKGGE